jgi:hypothetical protein
VRTPPTRGIPVLSVAGRSAGPCSACQPREDMISSSSPASSSALSRSARSASQLDNWRAGCSVELFEATASAGAARWLGLPPGPVAGPSASRRSPGSPLPPRLPDEPSVPPRAGWADGYLSAIEWRDGGKLHRHSLSLSVTLSMDETSRQAFVRSGVSGLLEAPMSRRPRCFVDPVPAATHLHQAGAGARYAADE